MRHTKKNKDREKRAETNKIKRETTGKQSDLITTKEARVRREILFAERIKLAL